MTDEQLVKFILQRAAKNCKQFHIYDPKLVIFKGSTSSLYLGVQFDDLSGVFFVRFTNGSTCGMFKINPADDGFKEWRESLVKTHGSSFMIEYDLDTLPAYVKHYVSYAFIETLKTKGMGADLFSMDFGDDVTIISQNESYEEAAIEVDMMALQS